MTIDIEALEAALAKATKGEWNMPEAQRADAAIFAGDAILNMNDGYDQLGLETDDAECVVALVNIAPALIAEHRRMAARIAELEYALQLADYALSGSNMNMNVVERKVRAALASKP